MDRTKIIIIKPTIEDIKNFFCNNKSNFFRYFEKRGYTSISNHKYTALYLFEEVVFGYGHIDFEERNWLGIFVIEEFRGKKLSRYILEDLLNNCQEDIYLTVDLQNINAINLYNSVGFNIIETNDKYQTMVYKK